MDAIMERKRWPDDRPAYMQRVLFWTRTEEWIGLFAGREESDPAPFISEGTSFGPEVLEWAPIPEAPPGIRRFPWTKRR